MKGIRVKDLVPQGYLAFDLRDFLDLLGEAAYSSHWLISGEVWATGDRAQELEALADGLTRIPGVRLRELAGAVHQVIEGEFAGFNAAEAEPWVAIHAVDSSYYEFFCRDDAILQTVKERFRAVAECELGPEFGPSYDEDIMQL